MTIFDLKCDHCGNQVNDPSRAQRILYHLGNNSYADNATLFCLSCWTEVQEWLGQIEITGCGVCTKREEQMLWVQSVEDQSWKLCKQHTVEFLNGLGTVEPKLKLSEFEWPPPVVDEATTPSEGVWLAPPTRRMD